ncbi:Hypothetical predicted protein [Mytilus galloprovincialis]|uniref:Uncharacterized protein n=1 Tax=Mytilus galloprovincialis TaxID=29158 RepID=A0A8B6HC09_MYTGA|nr:Hypothetical predicted protein [Mytilus galloprovincialis]
MVVLICISAWNKTDSAISFKDDTNNDISFKNETFCKTSLESIGSISEYKNQTACEFTNLKQTVEQSSRGMLYPLHKSKELVLIKFNDSNLIAIEIRSKCLHKLGDFFFRWLSVHDIQNLFGNCTNEVLFRKLFCDPIVTYNISYNEHEIFPYFSNVGLYFTDESNFCTPRFRQFVKTNNDWLNNNDINFFLRNITSCWKYMYFTNQVNIELPSGSLTSDENHFFKGDVILSYSSGFQLYFASKQEFCVNQFLSNLFSDGSNEEALGAHYIWYDYIIEFTSKTDCLEVKTECRRGIKIQFTLYQTE